MKAHLYYPEPGAVHVEPTTEVVVCFQSPPEDWRDTAHIKIGGEPAVISGAVQKGYETTRIMDEEEHVLWGVRRVRGLPPKDVMVQAWCSPENTTLDQRFFVRGAHTRSMSPPIRGPRSPVFGGFFVVGQDQWHIGRDTYERPQTWLKRAKPVYRDGEYFAVYPEQGRICSLVDDEIIVDSIPRFVFRGARSWDISPGWKVVSCNGDETFLCKKKEIHTWDISAKSVSICGGWIHLNMGEFSAHLPSSYWPARCERGLDSWYIMPNPGDGKMVFSKDMFVWWNKERMLVRHEPYPMIGKSQDIMWERDDIDEDFESVKIIDDSHVLVNKSNYLNTLHPAVTKI